MTENKFTVRNEHGIYINICCASCKRKEINLDGSHYCTKTRQEVTGDFRCWRWRMSKRFLNAGKSGGVVKQKGTSNIIIK